MVDPLSETAEPSRRATLDADSATLGLRVVASPDPSSIGKIIECTEHARTIGRAGELPDPAVSREHARLRINVNGELIVEHVGGAQGTFVNRKKIGGPTALADNDVITLGDTILVVDRTPDRHALPARDDASATAAHELAGLSYYAEQLRRSIDTVARTREHVLLLGATGTGKEVAARAIHRLSGREGPFVAVNAAALPIELAESTLFGHKKGAFTGAMKDHDGLFVEARGGTLFLDEIGDIPAAIQAKLLRVLEDGRVHPVGGATFVETDARIVCATQPDRANESLRSDLLARLSAWTIELLPLARHRADVIELWRRFASVEVAETTDFLECLLLYDWPQNAREVRNLRRRLETLRGSGSTFELASLPKNITARAPSIEAPVASRMPSKETLEELLAQSNGNIRKLANDRGWHRTQIYRWAKQHGIDLGRFRAEPEE